MDNVDTKMTRELSQLAYRIKKARQDANLSQKTLAKHLGVSDKAISAYEQGRSTPPVNKLKKIAKETSRPLSYFTEEEVSSPPAILHKLRTVEKQLEEIKKLLQENQ